MQYVRMLTNSMLAGALVGAYVALLVLQLNPTVQLNSMAVARLVLTWLAFYGVHATAFFYSLTVLRQLLAVEVRSPGWVSLRLLAAFGHDRSVDERRRHLAESVWLPAGPGPRRGVTHDGRRGRPDTVCRDVRVSVAAAAAIRVQPWRPGGGVRADAGGVDRGAAVFPGAGESTPPPRTPVAPQLAPAQSSARVQMILLDGASLDFIAPNAPRGAGSRISAACSTAER
jgi:hypothetical protein